MDSSRCDCCLTDGKKTLSILGDNRDSVKQGLEEPDLVWPALSKGWTRDLQVSFPT